MDGQIAKLHQYDALLQGWESPKIREKHRRLVMGWRIYDPTDGTSQKKHVFNMKVVNHV